MKDQMDPENNDESSRSRDRRELLRLGVAGLPMMITLKASAQQAAVSQLQCFFRLPERVRVMVNADGDAWASTTHNVRFSRRRQAYRRDDLEEFLQPGNSTRFMGGVPSGYRPSSCSNPPDPESNWIDCGWNKFSIGRNAKITPANYLVGSSWQLSGNKGLYLALTLQYAQAGANGGWPGVSCVVSILNYLGQN